MPRKRGKLSIDEMQFIEQNVHELTIDEIAVALNRTTAPIIKYIKVQNLKNTSVVSDEEYQRTTLLNKLHDRNYFSELNDMLTKSELARFEEDWVEVMVQFNDDVKYTEEIQVKQWILLQVLADRSMKNRREVMESADDLQAQIDAILAQDQETRDGALLDSLSNQLTFARDGMIAFTREHAQVLDKIKDIEKGLKANRDARVKRVDDGKTTWAGYTRILEDETRRRDAGDDAEIMRIAKDKAKERLSKWHKFEDGKVDQPHLTPENTIDEFDLNRQSKEAEEAEGED